MTIRAVTSCACLLALLSLGCSAASRHEALTTFFDGVPPPKTAPTADSASAQAAAGAAATRRVVYVEHGPYAAKLCDACHQSGASNALVVPKDELCTRCHVVDLDRKYVHGPLASGGCLACHDPHSSGNRFLLVSDSDSYCVRCHDPQAVQRIAGHAELKENCTDCHDAHGSDTQYLLK
jgi:predicted CXXCH cytochrome family protein